MLESSVLVSFVAEVIKMTQMLFKNEASEFRGKLAAFCCRSYFWLIC
jgi:hypothetical protein